MSIEAKRLYAVSAVLFLALHMTQVSECETSIEAIDEEIPDVICASPGIFCWCRVSNHDSEVLYDYKDMSDEVQFSYPNDTNGELLCSSTCLRKCASLFQDKKQMCNRVNNGYNSSYQSIGCYSQLGEKPDFASKPWTQLSTPEDLCCETSKKGCETEYGPGYVYVKEHNMCLKEVYDGCIFNVPFNSKKPPVCCLTNPSTGRNTTYGCQPTHTCGLTVVC